MYFLLLKGYRFSQDVRKSFEFSIRKVARFNPINSVVLIFRAVLVI